MKTCVLFVAGTDAELSAFVQPEMHYLCNAFDRVILVPSIRPNTSILEFPNLEIDYSWADWPKTSARLGRIREFMALKWVFDIPRIKTYRNLHDSLWNRVRIRWFKHWFDNFVKREGISLDDTCFYTFWLTTEAYALSEIAINNHLVYYSRAHGYDIYDRGGFRAQNSRRRAVSNSRGVFCCSKDGADFMRSEFPKEKGKIHVAYLGVNGARAQQMPPPDASSIKLLTVANLVSVKRIAMFCTRLKEIAEKRVDLQFEYSIVGEGPERGPIKKLLDAIPSNLKINLIGAIPNERVWSLYREYAFHYYVLVSESEGFGLSVAEAMAHGIPAIVTNVGGIPELVNSREVGFVIPKDFVETDLEPAFDFIREKEYANMRKNARSRILSLFDQKKCRMDFVDVIQRR